MSAPPPESSFWDLPLAEAPLAFVDLEMTGLDAVNDRVVEVCIERIVGGQRVDFVSTLVKPSERAGNNSNIHGIDEAALENAPPFVDVAPAILKALEGAIFIAHGAIWDIRFLEAEMKRIGTPLEIPHYIDTLSLTRRAFALRGHSLDALCVHFAIDRGVAHRAASDVTALRAVFDRCVTALAPKTPRDLWEVRIAERHARPEIVQACTDAVDSTVEIVYRAARKSAETMLIVIKVVRVDLDPPRVIGYQLPGRGRCELRADRILRVTPVPRT
ncbi:MAG: 3'-5' exonuclease [Polyangiaceae bacterium]